MTLLNYIIQPGCIEIYSDLLALDIENKEAVNFKNKVLLLPQFYCAVSCTGFFDLLLNWYLYIQKYMIPGDVKTLDKYAPHKLAELYSELDTSITTSIYNFGYILMENKFIGFRYRSSNDFKSETIDNSAAFKPYGQEMLRHIIDNGINILEINGMLDVIKRQKMLDDIADISEKVGIGGKVYYIKLERIAQLVAEIYMFDDCKNDHDKIMDRAKE